MCVEGAVGGTKRGMERVSAFVDSDDLVYKLTSLQLNILGGWFCVCVCGDTYNTIIHV